MKRPFSSYDVYKIVQELKVLEGAKVEKIYEWKDPEFLLRLYKHGSKHKLVISKSKLYITQKSRPAMKTPLGYCTFLRKHLGGANINSIDQVEFERVVKISFEKRERKLDLYIELFSPGNFILCEEDIIIHPFERQQFQSRTVQSKIKYELPPSQKNPFQKDFLDVSSDRKIGTYIATKIGLGGIYSNELIEKAEIDKNKQVNELNSDEIDKLTSSISNFLNMQTKPFSDGEDPYPVEMITKKQTKTYETFSQAIDDHVSIEESEKESNSKKPKKSKTQTIIDIQEKTAKKLEKQIEENREKADYIYENYQTIAQTIKLVNETLKEKGEKELKKIIKKSPRLISYDPKEKTITFETK